MTQVFADFWKIVRSKERFLISCHVHPDGDAIGSLLAVGLSLRKLGKSVAMVCGDGVPSVYSFLEGCHLIQRDMGDFQPDCVICLDRAEKERAALPMAIWEISELVVVNIDHHITNMGFGNLNIIQSQAAATGEVVYQLLSRENICLDKAIATAIYTAIATDTGFFRYSSTSSFTLETVAGLVKNYFVEPSKVAEQVHEQKSYNSIRLLGVLLNSLQLGVGGKVAWMVLDQPKLTQFPVENEETESYVNYARSVEGVEVGILFKELKPNEVKLSWRSSSAVDVSKLAGYFGGGGHARAAGCTISGPVQEVVDQVIEFISNYYGAAHVARDTEYQ